MVSIFGLKGIQAKISNHFQEKGFDGNQIAKAIFIHEVLGIALLGIVANWKVVNADLFLIYTSRI